MYVNIILTGDNLAKIEKLKKTLATEFGVRDFGQMRYYGDCQIKKGYLYPKESMFLIS